MCILTTENPPADNDVGLRVITKTYRGMPKMTVPTLDLDVKCKAFVQHRHCSLYLSSASFCDLVGISVSRKC